MSGVVRLPLTPAQRALARFRDEQRAFGVVLAILKETRREALFLKIFSLYRTRMRHLRRVGGATLDAIDSRTAAEELRGFSRERDP
jgi:hypothetical protein